MIGYMQVVIASWKIESEEADVKEVRNKAASVEVTTTGNGGELVALTEQGTYSMLIVESKNNFSKGKGNQRNKKNETETNNGKSNSSQENANNNRGNNGNQNHNWNKGRKPNRNQLQYYRCKGWEHFA